MVVVVVLLVVVGVYVREKISQIFRNWLRGNNPTMPLYGTKQPLIST